MGKRFPPIFLAVFLLPVMLEAGEWGDHYLAGLYYNSGNYSRAFDLYQGMILRQDAEELSGDILYRWGSCYEQIRGLDETALKIYALSWYYSEKAGRFEGDSFRAVIKLEEQGMFGGLDDESAASTLAELRTLIENEQKSSFYVQADRFYAFFSRFSIFQWKILLSLAMFIPFLAGILTLFFRGQGSRL
ncbi:MAG: hypothetical protein LBH51_04440 [Treponema sp.]|jgi:tetratricopeptide (TPR) repeat protein|nr:hypothetical protein [Treponema sp.]